MWLVVAPEALCQRCQRPLNSAVYQVRIRGEISSRCLRCALTHGPLMARSFLICLGVGTLLVAINQGNVILQGDASMTLAWKIPLTYAVTLRRRYRRRYAELPPQFGSG